MQTTYRSRHTSRKRVEPKARKRHLPLRMIALVVAVIVALGAGGGAAWAYNYNNTKDLSWYLSNPNANEYTITTGGQLHAFSALVNGDAINSAGEAIPAVDFTGKTVKLASGLNLFDNEFTPIGTVEHPFNGTFDGQGNVLSRLKISTPPSTQNVGLFGVTGKASVITSVGLNQNCNITLTSDSAPFINVGGIVGDCQGSIFNCSSAAKTVLTHSATTTKNTVIQDVGGVVGKVAGAISGSSHSGTLEIKTPANAYVVDDVTYSFLVKNVGGVVGSSGSTISSTANSGSLLLITSGAGGVDRFGSNVDSKSINVGGIVGLSLGSIDGCTNSGTLLTSANSNASVSDMENSATRESDGGADNLGGIVGNLRSETYTGFDGYLADAGMEPEAATLVVSNCKNTGYVSGLHYVGGIVGNAGSNTLITRVVNGDASNPNLGHVRTTRWNKPYGAGIVSVTCGDVTYSRNHGVSENTKTGYGSSGIVGVLTKRISQPQTPEVYACYNTGNIYCAGGNYAFREGGIVGENRGFVHDNVFLFGTVSSHLPSRENAAESAVGSNFGVVSGTTVVYERLKDAQDNDGLFIGSGEVVAVLNSVAASGEWANYYFISNSVNKGYPILNGEAPPESAVDLSKVACTLTLQRQAEYSSSYNPAPSVRVSILVDGRTIQLLEGADYKVIPDASALNESGICKGITEDETPYSASIEGIGNYAGSPETTVKYGITKGNFTKTTVVAENDIWTGSNQVPRVTVLDSAGGIVQPSEYSLLVNDGKECVDVDTYKVKATAFDDSNYSGASEGDYQIVSVNLYTDVDVIGIFYDKSVWFYDEQANDIYEVTPILDSSGDFQYDERGLIMVEGFATFVDADGRELTSATPKRIDGNGKPVYGDFAVSFTGKIIEPQCIGVLYNGELLIGKTPEELASMTREERKSVDFTTIYGQSADRASYPAPRNTNATHNPTRPDAALIIAGNTQGHFSNYVFIDFSIEPIEVTDSNISIVQLTQTLPYNNGSQPTTPVQRYSAERGTYNSAVEVHYLPDADNPDEFYVLDGVNWSLEFERAEAAAGGVFSGIYDSGTKVYFRIVPTEKTSLLGWDSISIADPWIIDPSSSSKTPLTSPDIEVTVNASTFNPSLEWPNFYPEFEVKNTVTGEVLEVGATSSTAGKDFYFASTPSSVKNPPAYSASTGTIDGNIRISAISSSNYSGALTIPFSSSKGVLQESIFKSPANGSWIFVNPGRTGVAGTHLVWRQNGWSAEELSEALVLNWRSGTANRIEHAYFVEDILKDGASVSTINEMNTEYILKVRFVPSKSNYFNSSQIEQFEVSVKMLPVNLSTASTWNTSYIDIYSSAVIEPKTYMYTGNYITPSLMVLDGAGNQIDPSFFEFVYPSSSGSKGQPKEPGSYNTGSSYQDLIVTGSGAGVYTKSATANQNIYQSFNRPGFVTDLSFSVVPADISNDSLVEIVVDDAYYKNGLPVEPKINFYDAEGNKLNYYENTDYTLSYSGNTDIGEALVSVIVVDPSHLTSQTNNSDGRAYVDVKFNIQGDGISVDEVAWNHADTIALDGGTLSPGVVGTVAKSGATVPEDSYEVIAGTYDGETFTPKSAGWNDGDTVYLQVTGIKEGVLAGTKVLEPAVRAKSLDASNDFAQLNLTVSAANTVFTGIPALPAATVVLGNETLIKGRDFSLSSTDTVAGNAAVTVTGIGAFAGSTTAPFTILPADIANVTLDVSPQQYTGLQVRPDSTAMSNIKLGSYALSPSDFEIVPDGYGENVNVASGGALSLKPGASGNFEGILVKSFAITPAPLVKANLQIDIPNKTYIGAPVELEADDISITDKTLGKTLLMSGDGIVGDFAIGGYRTNFAAGTATVYLTGNGNYSSSSTVTEQFTIEPLAFDADLISGLATSYEHNGTAVRPVPLVGLPASDYIVTYGDNNVLGEKTGWVRVTPVVADVLAVPAIAGNLTGAPVEFEFDIIANLSTAQVEAVPNGTYTVGGSYEPDVSVAFNGIELTEGTDYSITYDTSTAGEKTLLVSALAPNVGQYELSYSIAQRPLSAAGLALGSIEAQVFTGAEQKPVLTLTDGSTPLVEGIDYDLSYSNNLNATTVGSKAVATVAGKGNYAGVLSQQFEIAPRSLDTASVLSVIANGKYTGQGTVGAVVSLSDSSRIDAVTQKPYVLVEGTDYMLSYTGNNKAGTATVTIKGIGNYDFILEKQYTIEAAEDSGNNGDEGSNGDSENSGANSNNSNQNNTGNASNTSNGRSTTNNYYNNQSTSNTSGLGLPSPTASDNAVALAPQPAAPTDGTSANSLAQNDSGASDIQAPDVPLTNTTPELQAEGGIPTIYLIIIAGIIAALLIGIAATLVARKRKTERELRLRQ